MSDKKVCLHNGRFYSPIEERTLTPFPTIHDGKIGMEHVPPMR